MECLDPCLTRINNKPNNEQTDHVQMFRSALRTKRVRAIRTMTANKRTSKMEEALKVAAGDNQPSNLDELRAQGVLDTSKSNLHSGRQLTQTRSKKLEFRLM